MCFAVLPSSHDWEPPAIAGPFRAWPNHQMTCPRCMGRNCRRVRTLLPIPSGHCSTDRATSTSHGDAMLSALDLLVPFLVALSLASERLVTLVKTLFPWLTVEKQTPAQEVDLIEDRPRRIIVQLLAFAAALITTMLVANTGNPFAQVPVGKELRIPVYLVAFLASGGSAFWNNVLGFTKAAKDVKQVEKASVTLNYHAQAALQGVTAVDGGATARGTLPQDRR